MPASFAAALKAEAAVDGSPRPSAASMQARLAKAKESLNGGVVICMSVSEAVAIGRKGVGRACEACNEDAALVRVIVLR